MEMDLQVPKMCNNERFSRLFAQLVASLLPDASQYSFLKQLKAFRFRIGGADFDTLMASWDNCLQKTSGADNPGAGGGMFAITHDVDYCTCFDYLPVLLDIDRSLGIKATYNFLTRGGYNLESGMLRSVLDAGNEIGLHGLTHDRALGCRSKQYIREFIGISRGELEKKTGEVRGFRAPALAVTAEVVEVLEELGFLYDSSLTNTSLSSRFTPSLKPFVPSGSRITEIPLTVQDSVLFNDFSLAGEQIECLFGKMIRMVGQSSGCLVGNFHPTVIRNNRHHYEMIIQMLKAGLKQDYLMRDLPAMFSVHTAANGGCVLPGCTG